MNATEIALDAANAVIARLQAELDASQKRNRDTHRERLDRFVAAALTGRRANWLGNSSEMLAKESISDAEAVLAELERREKEGQ